MTATWRAVARKDVEDAARSRKLWALIGIFVAFLAMALPSAEQMVPEPVTVDATVALAGVAALAQLFIPGIALVAGYMAVAGERQSGSLRVLLSYPFSRRDVVAGKLAGRVVVTGAALGVSYVVGIALTVALYGVPDPVAAAGFVATGVLFGLVFTGLAVGGSAAAADRGRAMLYTLGAWLVMVFFWKPVVAGLYYAVNGTLPELHADRWYFVLRRLNPVESFRVVTGAVLGEPVRSVPRIPVEEVPMQVPAAMLELSNRLTGEVPFYLEEWSAVLVLLLWGVVPVLLGYRRFDRADLS